MPGTVQSREAEVPDGEFGQSFHEEHVAAQTAPPLMLISSSSTWHGGVP